MTDLTEEGQLEPVEVSNGASLMLQLPDGDYLLLPNVSKFLEENNGTAMMIQTDGDILVLRKGLKKNEHKWISIIADAND